MSDRMSKESLHDSSSEKLANTNVDEYDTRTAEEQVAEAAEKYGVNHKKLMWKIDLCVVPPFCLLYFLSFLDRVNISNANVYGLSTDLNLVGNQYNTCLTLFFVPYVFFEVFSNYALKFIPPHRWLSGCIMAFGAVSIGMGFVKNFGGLAACRFLLGVFESGSFPALFYILANFYEKGEAQRRFSGFFSVTALAGAAGGAIAYRMNDLDGKHGLESWRWIFIIDGIVTCAGAILLYFTIADFPEQAKFLNDNERKFLKEKLAIHSGTESGFEIKDTPKDVLGCFKDYLIWLPALAYFGLIIPSYGYAYFAATIIKQMGYTAVSAQQHSVYPWLAAFGLINTTSFISDRFKIRLPFAIGSSLLAIAGLAMVYASTDPHTRYAGCFLTASGLYSAMPLLVCWSSLNFGGHLRKGVGTAWQIGFGNIGGIIATFVFLAKDAPKYGPGLIVGISFVCFSILMMLLYFFSVYRLNGAKKTEAYQTKFAALSDRQRVQLGDRNPTFTYLY
ncbi:high-affinity nicotinic acid transporter [[Candida] railenensis]|uniref:High-affinity nicotinic acid transporter n=1 Tax=[Candida] railenensis TaxID=45579 RepID=A0A9P0QRP1_9ASCO|nr:high-affinity nicotinic acid transporter [[Candida] railenensis]